MSTMNEKDAELAHRIQNVLGLDARGVAPKISVAIHGACATLKGDVHTWAEHEAAERAALAMPGVTTVDNQLSLYVCGKLSTIHE